MLQKLHLQSRELLNSTVIGLLNSIDAGNPEKNIYLLGRNNLALSVFDQVKVTGIIDDFFDLADQWNGIPIFKSSQIKDSIVINCSTSIFPMSAEIAINKVKGLTLILYADLHQFNPNKYPLPEPLLSRHQSFLKDQEQWQQVFNSLKDDASKQLLNNIVNFNASADYHFLKAYKVAPSQQYFEDFMDYKNEVFVDVGGYTGDTSELFCTRYPDYKHVYLFEPSPINMQKAKQNLSSYENITFIEKGVSDCNETLYFDPELGSASAVTSKGNNNSFQIKTTTIDEVCTNSVSFIKMDIEGLELKAIKGAEKTIAKETPKLAISVYHNGQDIWQIYQLIMSINKNYNVYLRHYTEGWSETIMYFLPHS